MLTKLKNYVTKGIDYLKANKSVICATVLITGSASVVLGANFIGIVVLAGVIVYVALKLDK